MKDVGPEQEGLPNAERRVGEGLPPAEQCRWGRVPNRDVSRLGARADPEEVLRLVQASRAGDRAAFDRLVLLHQRQAVGLALGILGNRDDAAEPAAPLRVGGRSGSLPQGARRSGPFERTGTIPVLAAEDRGE